MNEIKATEDDTAFSFLPLAPMIALFLLGIAFGFGLSFEVLR